MKRLINKIPANVMLAVLSVVVLFALYCVYRLSAEVTLYLKHLIFGL